MLFRFRHCALIIAAVATLPVAGCKFYADHKLPLDGRIVSQSAFQKLDGIFLEEQNFVATDSKPFPGLLKISVDNDGARTIYKYWSCSDGGNKCWGSEESAPVSMIYTDLVTKKSWTDFFFGEASFPVGWFVGEYKSSNWDYYIFRWTGSGIEYVKGSTGFDMSNRYKVASPEELARKAKAQIENGEVGQFKLISQREAYAKFQQLSATTNTMTSRMVDAMLGIKTEEKFMSLADIKAGKNLKYPDPPPSYPKLAGLELGDTVYISGFFSDGAAWVLSVDHEGGRVHVMSKHGEGETQWVSADRLISRQESAVKDLVRGAAVLGAVICTFQPTACSK